MLNKNLPLSEKLWKLPVRFGLDAISAWKGLLTGDLAFFTAIMKAHWAVVKIWLMGKSEKNHRVKKPMKSLQGVYSGTIVWDYFINKRTRFQEIIRRKIL